MKNLRILKVKEKKKSKFFIDYFDVDNLNDRVVSRVIFIDARFGRRDAANLIAGGPYGHIHFWNIYRNGILMAKFRPVNIFLIKKN
jgi:hypothetical protein